MNQYLKAFVEVVVLIIFPVTVGVLIEGHRYGYAAAQTLIAILIEMRLQRFSLESISLKLGSLDHTATVDFSIRHQGAIRASKAGQIIKNAVESAKEKK